MESRISKEGPPGADQLRLMYEWPRSWLQYTSSHQPLRLFSKGGAATVRPSGRVTGDGSKAQTFHSAAR